MNIYLGKYRHFLDKMKAYYPFLLHLTRHHLSQILVLHKDVQFSSAAAAAYASANKRRWKEAICQITVVKSSPAFKHFDIFLFHNDNNDDGYQISNPD